MSIKPVSIPQIDYPYRDTEAAEMLRSGINQQKEKGRSLRAIAKSLSYSQATVLSHMANGRVRIPIERATEIARTVEIDERGFLASVVAQQTKDAKLLLAQATPRIYGFLAEIELIADTPLDNLSDDQKNIIREVVSDSRAARRWLSLAELPTVEMIRRSNPGFSEAGLTSDEMKIIHTALDKSD